MTPGGIHDRVSGWLSDAFASIFAGWAIETLIASTVLMIAVLAIRAPVRKAFGAQVAYALWILPFFRMLLPPMPREWFATWHAAAMPIVRAGESITVFVADPAGSAAVASAPHHPSLGLVLAALWGMGAAVFLCWHTVQHSRFCQRMLHGSDRFEVLDNVRIIASTAATGPLAFGIFRRYVAFPKDFDERYDADERALALAHEIGHHQRGDLIANWAALVVLALHWFNPVAWRAFRTFRADQELANDARVLAGRSAVDRHIYACAIVKAAHGGAVSAACHLHTITDLKGRLRMLTTTRSSSRRLATGVASVAALVVTGLGLTASGTSAAARIGSSIDAGLQQAAPLISAVPAAPAVPPIPGVPSVPAVPAVPPVASADAHGHVTTMVVRNGRTVSSRTTRTVDGKDGVTTVYASAPSVTERNCTTGKDGDDRQFVLQSHDDGKHVMVVCTNRIQKAAADGAKIAANSRDIQRNALRSAIDGLRGARSTIAGNMSMSAAQRAEALAGIDQGIAEVESDIAKAD